MAETRFHVDVDKALKEMTWIQSQHAESQENDGEPYSTMTSESDSASRGDASDPEIVFPSSYPGTSGGFRRTVSMAELAASELVITRKIENNMERS